jgi:hypothetical protein
MARPRRTGVTAITLAATIVGRWFTERHEHHARARPDAGGREQDKERDRDDDPAIVDASGQQADDSRHA